MWPNWLTPQIAASVNRKWSSIYSFKGDRENYFTSPEDWIRREALRAQKPIDNGTTLNAYPIGLCGGKGIVLCLACQGFPPRQRGWPRRKGTQERTITTNQSRFTMQWPHTQTKFPLWLFILRCDDLWNFLSPLQWWSLWGVAASCSHLYLSTQPAQEALKSNSSKAAHA